MKFPIIAALAIGFASTSNAQQKQVHTSKVVKDSKVAKFKPPVIVKNKSLKSKKHKKEAFKFAPPVIVKD